MMAKKRTKVPLTGSKAGVQQRLDPVPMRGQDMDPRPTSGAGKKRIPQPAKPDWWEKLKFPVKKT